MVWEELGSVRVVVRVRSRGSQPEVQSGSGRAGRKPCSRVFALFTFISTISSILRVNALYALYCVAYVHDLYPF